MAAYLPFTTLLNAKTCWKTALMYLMWKYAFIYGRSNILRGSEMDICFMFVPCAFYSQICLYLFPMTVVFMWLQVWGKRNKESEKKRMKGEEEKGRKCLGEKHLKIYSLVLIIIWVKVDRECETEQRERANQIGRKKNKGRDTQRDEKERQREGHQCLLSHLRSPDLQLWLGWGESTRWFDGLSDSTVFM